MQHLGPSIRRFGANSTAATSVEFALAMPIILAVLVGIIELGCVMFANVALESAVKDAARFGVTGRTLAGASRIERIETVIRQKTFGFARGDRLTVDTLIYPGFASIGQPEPFVDTAPANGHYDVGEMYTDINGNGQWDSDMGRPGAGAAGDIVLYTATLTWPGLTGLFRPFGNGLALRASVIVRNEPYDP